MTDSITPKNHKKLPHSRHEFDVEVSPARMSTYFEHAYARLAPAVEIKGFRPGQAPRLMTIQKIGQQRYFQEAMDLALPATYAEAMKSLELRPVAPPEISIQSYGEGAPLVYHVTVDVIPDVDPGEYAKVRVKATTPDTAVNADEVNDVLERLRKQQAQTKEVDRPAKKGDRVEIDYVGTVDNVKRDDLSSQHFPVILGDEVLPKDLEASLVGKKKGDAYELETKVEKQAVKFSITVHSVAEVTLPEVDAAFAKQFGRKDADDLKDAIKKQLALEKADVARKELEEKVLDAVLKKAKVELPKSLVEEEITRRVEHIKSQLGVMYPKFLEQKKLTEEKIRKEFEAPAEQSVKTGLVLGEIAKKEGFGKEQKEGEDDAAFQRRVVRRVVDFLVASATGEKTEKDPEKEKQDTRKD